MADDKLRRQRLWKSMLQRGSMIIWMTFMTLMMDAWLCLLYLHGSCVCVCVCFHIQLMENAFCTTVQLLVGQSLLERIFTASILFGWHVWRELAGGLQKFMQQRPGDFMRRARKGVPPEYRAEACTTTETSRRWEEDFQTVLKLKRYLCMPGLMTGSANGGNLMKSVIREREKPTWNLVFWSGLEDGSERRSTCKARPLQGQVQLGVMRAEVIWGEVYAKSALAGLANSRQWVSSPHWDWYSSHLSSFSVMSIVPFNAGPASTNHLLVCAIDPCQLWHSGRSKLRGRTVGSLWILQCQLSLHVFIHVHCKVTRTASPPEPQLDTKWPRQKSLFRILKAYANLCPDVGYCQILNLITIYQPSVGNCENQIAKWILHDVAMSCPRSGDELHCRSPPFGAPAILKLLYPIQLA